MSQFKNVKLVFLSTVVASVVATACGDVEPDGLGLTDEDVEFRPFCSFPCSGGGNSPVVGGRDISTWPQTTGGVATHPTTGDKMMIHGAWVPFEKEIIYTVDWDVLNNGELQFTVNTVGGPKTVGGTDVIGAEFNVTIDTGQVSHNAKIRVIDADDTASPVVQYLLATNHVPVNIGDHSEYVIDYESFYTLCPNDDNGGALAGDTIYHSVFASHTAVDVSSVEPVSVAENLDSVLCVNGATSKGMWQHNVFFDWKYDPHPRALSGDDQNNALVNAYRAFFDGQAHTQMGEEIYLLDIDGGLFTFWEQDLPPNAVIEGYYGATGQNCREEENWHRWIHGTLIDDYLTLPECGTAGAADHIAVAIPSYSTL